MKSPYLCKRFHAWHREACTSHQCSSVPSVVTFVNKIKFIMFLYDKRAGCEVRPFIIMPSMYTFQHADAMI